MYDFTNLSTWKKEGKSIIGLAMKSEGRRVQGRVGRLGVEGKSGQ